MKSKIKTIGITLGDPSGIGPEITAKALKKTSLYKNAKVIVIGEDFLFKKYFPKKLKNVELLPVGSIQKSNLKVGTPNRASAKTSIAFLDKSIELIKNKRIDALVTAPLCKEAVNLIKKGFHGHTEYIADKFKGSTPGMMFVANGMRTMIVTRHIPISQVKKHITKKKVFHTINITHTALKKLFKIKNPSIALTGLNPHAGESGLIGKEDSQEILPAVKQANQKGMKTFGPFAADTLFHKDNSKSYDCIIAMYHDQGLIPIKTLYLHELVNLTIGLPFIRTSPAHGTAFDLAGKNKAKSSSMEAALKLAISLTNKK